MRRTQEQVIGIWTETANFEDFEHIKELAVDVADDSDGGGDVYNIALLHQHFFRFCTYCFNQGFGKELLFVELRDAFIEVNAGCTRVR